MAGAPTRISKAAWHMLPAPVRRKLRSEPGKRFMRFVPGPGLGGHCIPVDPLYLTWKAKAYNFPTRFIELAVEIDRRMPYHVHELVVRALRLAAVDAGHETRGNEPERPRA